MIWVIFNYFVSRSSRYEAIYLIALYKIFSKNRVASENIEAMSWCREDRT
ncbi:hypothetical protein SAMN02745132_03732 [Enterovibrio nigricans DSM 22720]|uniref:Uncharacterized protein n=1 Tax=Enterovibrio nigricans DSM 22720 TaxID=1121868 RepID=A0A1T4VEC5_9GAMM|nr:hypothetical protein SAMN02745132_03732 [Enterovibrio nigricans DSM 22720]